MSDIYKFYPGIGFQNINLKKLNENFDLLCSDIISLKVNESDTISVGSKGLFYIPYDLKIVGWIIGTYTTSSMTIDIRKCTAETYPNTVSITGDSKIVLDNAMYAENNVLSSWDSNLKQNNWVEFYFESTNGTNKADIILKVTR